MWSYKIFIDQHFTKEKQKSIKFKNNFILLEILRLIFKTEDNLSRLPFSPLITVQLIFTSSKLGEQSKHETEARNLCLKDHYSQLYLASSFQEPFLQSTNWFYHIPRFSLTDVRLTFICINEVETVPVCASGFHVV